jgi:hypothetical protein
LAGATDYTDRATMLFHDSLTDGESKPWPLTASAKSRIKDVLEILLGYTLAGVCKVDEQEFFVRTSGDA